MCNLNPPVMEWYILWNHEFWPQMHWEYLWLSQSTTSYRIPSSPQNDSFSLIFTSMELGMGSIVICVISGVIVRSLLPNHLNWIKFGARPCLKVPWLHVSSPRRTKCLQSFWALRRGFPTEGEALPQRASWRNARMKMWKQRRNAYSKWIRENRSNLRCFIHPFHPISLGQKSWFRATKAQVMYVNGLRKVYGNFITGEVHWTSLNIMHYSTLGNNMTFIIHDSLSFENIHHQSESFNNIDHDPTTSSQVTHAVRGVTWAADQVPCQLVFCDSGWQFLPPQSIFQM